MSKQELNSFFRQLTKQQKWSLVGLIILGVVIFTMWFIQLKRSIIYPLYGNNNPDAILNQSGALDDNIDSALETLQKQTDSDEDTLSDWDEENLYKTSPYLPDSDSDGIKDAEEIAQGKDPNCPEGEECFAGETVINETTTTTTTTGTNTGATTTSTGLETLSPEELSTVQQIFGTNPDAATIRSILLKSGADKTELDKISDEQLIATFNSMQKQQ